MNFPIFYKQGIAFQMIYREGATSYDLIVETLVNGVQTAWGGDPNESSIIMPDFTDADIMAKGGRRAFIEWGRTEAERRANDYATILNTPPDPNNHLASVLFHLEHSVHATSDSSGLYTDPAPLP